MGFVRGRDRIGTVEAWGLFVSNSAQFDGATYLPLFDQKRLEGQYEKVFAVMAHGGWWTLRQLANICECSEASISARIRDMRKEKRGGHTVNRRRGRCWDSGIHEYQLVVRRAK